MGLLIDSDLGGDPAAFTSRFSAARGNALGRLTAARVALMDNLSNLNAKTTCTQFVSSGRVDLQLGVSGVKGSWHEMIPKANLTFSVGFLLMGVPRFQGDAVLLDIGIGDSGQETVLIGDIPLQANYKFFLPIRCYIAARTRLSVRGSNSSSGSPARFCSLLAGG